MTKAVEHKTDLTARYGAHTFPCFDGFRAMAVCGVVLAHVTLQTGATVRSSLGPLYARLDVTPPLFFMISAFLLYRPYILGALSSRPRPRTRSFLWRRALRVLPAYWVAVTVVVFVAQTKSFPNIQTALQDYTLTHIYTPRTVFGPLLQSYTLATEISFYLFLPLYGWLMATRVRDVTPEQRLRVELAGVTVLFVLSWMFRSLILAFAVPNNGMLNQWLPARLDMFALGMCLAVVSAWHEHRGHGAVPGWLLGRAFPNVAWGLAALVYVLAAYHAGLPLGALRYTAGQQLTRDLLYEIIVVCIVLPGVFGPQGRGLVRRLLQSWPVALAGLVSYGIYLWHEVWLDKYLEWAGIRTFTGDILAMYTAVLALAIATATLSYHIVERPALRFKRWGPGA